MVAEAVEEEHREEEVDSVLVAEVAGAEAVGSPEVEVVASRLEVEEVRGEALPGVVGDYLLAFCKNVGV